MYRRAFIFLFFTVNDICRRENSRGVPVNGYLVERIRSHIVGIALHWRSALFDKLSSSFIRWISVRPAAYKSGDTLVNAVRSGGAHMGIFHAVFTLTRYV